MIEHDLHADAFPRLDPGIPDEPELAFCDPLGGGVKIGKVGPF
ncbi:MAG TPA: hypothetical protein VGI44_09500 [Acidimicrobiales bacterium]|jgi:hypothetical protein